MDQRPRPRDRPLLTTSLLARITGAGGFSATAAFLVLILHDGPPEQVRWLAYTMLVVAQAIRAYANRSLHRPVAVAPPERVPRRSGHRRDPGPGRDPAGPTVGRGVPRQPPGCCGLAACRGGGPGAGGPGRTHPVADRPGLGGVSDDPARDAPATRTLATGRSALPAVPCACHARSMVTPATLPIIRIRPIEPGDRDALMRFYEALSEDSLSLRFHGASKGSPIVPRGCSVARTTSIAKGSWRCWMSPAHAADHRGPPLP